MTGVPSKPPSRNISPMILSSALAYISAVSKRVTLGHARPEGSSPRRYGCTPCHIPIAWSYPTPRPRHREERCSAHPPEQSQACFAERLLSYLRLILKRARRVGILIMRHGLGICTEHRYRHTKAIAKITQSIVVLRLSLYASRRRSRKENQNMGKVATGLTMCWTASSPAPTMALGHRW